MNFLKTTALLTGLTLLFVFLGAQLGGTQGMVGMFVVAAVMNLGTWFFSDQIVLRTSGAQPIDDPRLRWIEEDVAEIAQKAGIPKPAVYWVPHERSPNAFATGRSPSKGVVAVTAGLLERLDRRQIRGVLAHEIGHIAHRDTLTSAIAATLAGAIAMLGRMAFWFGGSRDDRGGGALFGLVAMIVAPLAAMVLRSMISKTREYAADERAAALTGDPEGLAQALEGLAYGGQRTPMHTGSEATHYIVQRFGGSAIQSLFSTHPPIEERVKRLRARR